jgi:diketogulonate reductase-like aldo/keto reductase
LIAQLGVKYLDLYLIHDPGLVLPDIQTAWKKMEDLKNAGFARYVSPSLF